MHPKRGKIEGHLTMKHDHEISPSVDLSIDSIVPGQQEGSGSPLASDPVWEAAPSATAQ